MTLTRAYPLSLQFAEALRGIVWLAVGVGVTAGASLEVCLNLANSYQLRKDCPTTSCTRPGTEIVTLAVGPSGG